MYKTKRADLLTRWGHLRSERATWWSHWQEVTTYLLPRNGRYFEQDRNKGHSRHNSIYDNTGTRALRTLGAGMMAGATSPSRPWFRLGTADPELNKYPPVKMWLHDVTQRMQLVFQKSNTYRTLHGIYEELGAFGTAGSIILPDPKTAIHHYPVTIGEYAIATDYQGRVNTLYREFQKTVGELLREFGYSFQNDAYVATDLTLLAEHITDGGIVDVEYAQEPDSIYWAVRNDGTLLGMTYQREQDIVGWHRHIIGGKGQSCTVTVTDYDNTVSGTKLIFTKSDGTTVTFTSTTGTAGTNEFKTETNNNTTASNLQTTINGHADFTATVSSAVVTITETTPESTGFLTVDSSSPVRLAIQNETHADVKSITTISEASEDTVYIIVQRIINGSTVQYVEYLDTTLNQDSGLAGTVTGSSTTVTSLDHLEGETVQILIDDAVYPKQKVTNGAVTVSLPSTFESKTIEVGLGYVSTIKTLRPEGTAQAGTAQGRKKRYNEIIVRLLDSVGVTINGDQLPFRSSADEMGEPIPAFTGDKRVTNLGWNRDGQITIKQTQPLPMTVLAVTGTIVTTD